MAGLTCNNNTLPGSWDMGSSQRSFFAMPNWPESFVGMTECCKPNKLEISGDGEFKDCVLWCVIPDSILKPDGVNNGDRDEVAGRMKDCVEEKGGIEHRRAYVSSIQVRDDAASSGSRMGGGATSMSLLGVGVWALLVVGVLV